MGVSFHKPTGNWRVYRKANNEVKQFYFKNKIDAMEVDQAMEHWQSQFKGCPQSMFHANGKLKGINYIRFLRGDAKVEAFKIRTRSSSGQLKYTEVSVKKYGFNKAFEIAIKRYCDIKGIRFDENLLKLSKLYKENNLL